MRSEYVIRSVLTPAFTVAIILSTTCCAEHGGAMHKNAKMRTRNNFSRKDAKAQRESRKVDLMIRSMFDLLERLRNPEVQVSAVQPEDCGRAVEIHTSWPTLRNQELRRFQQEPIVNGERTAKRSLHPESKAYGVGPMR